MGQAVRELVYEELQGRVACLFCPVTVTAGSGRRQVAAGHGILAPKVELVGTLQVLLQTRRLRIADALPEAQILIRELETFRAVTRLVRAETVESWRQRDHDDLVLAVAVAAWLGEQALLQEYEWRG